MAESDMESEIYRFPEFFDRLEGRGMLRARDAVESETEVEGIVYHHRGVQLPANEVTYLWNPEGAESPTFRVEIDGVGPRRGWALFDATEAWDVYLMLYDGGAVVAWMSDSEFEAEEAERYPTKAQAISAGRFSFAAFFLFGPEWVEREDWAHTSQAPALIQLGDGRMLTPETVDEFYEADVAIPEELRDDPEPAPAYFGVEDAGLVFIE